jgi:hypothetical protein
VYHNSSLVPCIDDAENKSDNVMSDDGCAFRITLGCNKDVYRLAMADMSLSSLDEEESESRLEM